MAAMLDPRFKVLWCESSTEVADILNSHVVRFAEKCRENNPTSSSQEDDSNLRSSAFFHLWTIIVKANCIELLQEGVMRL